MRNLMIQVVTGFISVPDITPNTFSFTAINNAAKNTLVASNVVTVLGIDSPTTVSVVSGTGQFSINGGAWVTTGAIVNNQTLQVRQTTSALGGVLTSVTLLVGTATVSFDATTSATATDPQFSNVYSLLPFNNSYNDLVNGATYSTQISTSVAANGVTTQGLGSYVNYAARADGGGWNFAINSDFTVECFITFNAAPVAGNRWFAFTTSWTSFGFTPDGYPVATFNSNGTFIYSKVKTNFVIGTRYHVAVTRTNGAISWYVDGNLVGRNTGFGYNFGHITSQMQIGRDSYWTIDNFRLTKNLARYYDPFVPPTGPFPIQ